MKFVPNFDNSQSTAEVITMPTECHMIALEHEGTKKVLQRQHGDVILSTIFTQRRYDGLTTQYDGYKASCFEHDAF